MAAPWRGAVLTHLASTGCVQFRACPCNRAAKLQANGVGFETPARSVTGTPHAASVAGFCVEAMSYAAFVAVERVGNEAIHALSASSVTSVRAPAL